MDPVRKNIFPLYKLFHYKIKLQRVLLLCLMLNFAFSVITFKTSFFFFGIISTKWLTAITACLSTFPENFTAAISLSFTFTFACCWFVLLRHCHRYILCSHCFLNIWNSIETISLFLSKEFLSKERLACHIYLVLKASTDLKGTYDGMGSAVHQYK